MGVRIARTYEERGAKGGYRILVDRIWPRGLRKEELHYDEWLKDLAPSSALRKWFGHAPGRWDEFRNRYRQELETKEEEISRLRHLSRGSDLVLLFSARDREHNQAVILKELLES